MPCQKALWLWPAKSCSVDGCLCSSEKQSCLLWPALYLQPLGWHWLGQYLLDDWMSESPCSSRVIAAVGKVCSLPLTFLMSSPVHFFLFSFQTLCYSLISFSFLPFDKLLIPSFVAFHGPNFICSKNYHRASLVAQWLRICLPMQGTWVQALVREDPTCCGATKPVHHNYWACSLEPASHNYWAYVPQPLKPVRLEPVLCDKRSHCSEKPAHCNGE